MAGTLMLYSFLLQLLAVNVAGKGFVPLELPEELDGSNGNQEAPDHQKHLYEVEPEIPEEKAAVQKKNKDDAVKNILGRRHAQVGSDGVGTVRQESAAVADQSSSQETESVEVKEEEGPCPSVFVYSLKGELGKSNAPSGTLEGVFGEELRVPGWAAGVYKTKEESLLEIMLYRLRVGRRCPTAAHPDVAELFLVPILPSADAATWELHCDDLVNTDWPQALPFLEERTAAKHILVMPEPDEKGRIPCGKFWNDLPMGLRYSTILGVDIPSEKRLADLMPPTVQIVPRPTTVHWSSVYNSASTSPPWADWQKQRPIFAAFFGGVHGPQKFQRLRTHLRDNCDKDHKCEMIVKSDGHASEELRGEIAHIMKTKRRSTFCLEPPGTTFARQSLVQSILSGCIPVIFDKQQDNLFPWHWGPWRKGSRVLLEVPKACFASHEVPEECDIVSQLRTLSDKRIQNMQRKIAKSAHSLQYALNDYEGDAFELVLQEVRKIAKEESGKFPEREKTEDKLVMSESLKKTMSNTFVFNAAQLEMAQHEQYL